MGAFLDFPILLDDSEMRHAIELLEGESARIVSGVAKSMRIDAHGQKVLDSSEFLAQMPAAIQSFAAARLAAPEYETIEEARTAVSGNAKKLREINIARETNEIVREQHRVIGDWDTQVELAKHVDALVRQRQGLMGTRDAGDRSILTTEAGARVGQKHRGSDGDKES